MSVVVLALPIMAIIGGVTADKKPKQALILLVIPALGFISFGVFGGGVGGFGFTLPGVIMALAAFFVWQEMRALTTNNSTS